jgi:P-type Ca2+ transporter type 2C
MFPHAESATATSRRLDVDPEHGLAVESIVSRERESGSNRLPVTPPRSAWRVFAGQFSSALVLVLLGAAGLSAAIGNVKDAIVISCVVIINACFGFYQEYRAEQSLVALRSMLPARARVRRSSITQEIPAESLVPGDIVLVEAGDRIPADGRVIFAASLEIDESTLTGESSPVGKSTETLPDAPLAVGDRINLAFMNTLVTHGRGELVVTAIGPCTEIGQLSRQLALATEPPSPLQVQLDQLGKRLGVLAVALVSLLAVLSWLRGKDLAQLFIEAIALAVAAVPEGLPVVVTVTLAVGMQRMARQNAIVKRLASVETLGCTTVICSDKTGTLTLNQMTVRTYWCGGRSIDVDLEGGGHTASGGARDADVVAMLRAVTACNDSRIDQNRVIGDPMEGALLVLAAGHGVDRVSVDAGLPRLDEVPFDSVQKFMATFHRQGHEVVLYVKGAPDVLLDQCSAELCRGVAVPFNATRRGQVEEVCQRNGSNGLRGLLVASRRLQVAEFDASGDLSRYVADLTFLGLVGLMDPPRPEARAAIDRCRHAGIAVKMITGDHRSTATAIARELGIEGETLSGTEIERMAAAELSSVIDTVGVFARVAPEHKVKIVASLQAKGHVVAMTGDGVNDAPALKRADIGVAMGIAGTEVAKEAATMVLTDDNFATIVSAVHRGRVLYDNIVKFVRFQLSTTTGAILTVFFAPLLGLPEPFTPLQILWIAVIMDGPPAISLAFDAARPGLMAEPPRPRDAPLLSLPRVARILGFGFTMMVGTLAVLHYGLRTAPPEQALTLAFTTFVLFQFFNVFNARVESRTAFNASFFSNRMLWASIIGVLALQVLAVEWATAQRLFDTTALTFAQWALAAGVASSVLWLEEARKLLGSLGPVIRRLKWVAPKPTRT